MLGGVPRHGCLLGARDAGHPMGRADAPAKGRTPLARLGQRHRLPLLVRLARADAGGGLRHVPGVCVGDGRQQPLRERPRVGERRLHDEWRGGRLGVGRGGRSLPHDRGGQLPRRLLATAVAHPAHRLRVGLAGALHGVDGRPHAAARFDLPRQGHVRRRGQRHDGLHDAEQRPRALPLAARRLRPRALHLRRPRSLDWLARRTRRLQGMHRHAHPQSAHARAAARPRRRVAHGRRVDRAHPRREPRR
mmetsp:Transcript_8003/g.23668  ORF Transcript_8003/g.23668 Transcript_8003/m.23668 type:complete len:248 (-) Transcript_8003:579-1322(-)